MVAPQTRWSALLEILTREGRIEVEAAADELRDSAATIRRDLDELTRQQMVTRTHGGAVINPIAYDLPLRYKAARNAPEKERIADAVVGLVKAGAVVGLNGGTTTTSVARRAFARICPVGDVHLLVTGKAAGPELSEPFAAAGVEIIRA